MIIGHDNVPDELEGAACLQYRVTPSVRGVERIHVLGNVLGCSYG